MDYRKLYREVNEEVFNEMKTYIIEEFKKSNKLRCYLKIQQPIIEHYNNIVASLINKLKDINSSLLKTYNVGLSDYNCSYFEELIEAVCENEIEDLLVDFSDEDKHDIIYTLLKQDLISRKTNDFRNGRAYFDLIRQTEKYKWFVFKGKDGFSLDNTAEYKEMYYLLNPEDRPEVNKQTNISIKEFSDEEILVLRGVFYKVIERSFKYQDNRSVPFTKNDFNKMISILGNLEEEINLTSTANPSCTSYQTFLKLYDGLSSQKRHDKLDILIDKFKIYNIKPIDIALKKYRKINNI
jgi:hypothetical protein